MVTEWLVGAVNHFYLGCREVPEMFSLVMNCYNGHACCVWVVVLGGELPQGVVVPRVDVYGVVVPRLVVLGRGSCPRTFNTHGAKPALM